MRKKEKMSEGKISKAEKKAIEVRLDLDSSVTDGYGVCDFDVAGIHACDNLSYNDSKGLLGLAIKIIGYFMLLTVITLDIVWDIFFIATHLGGSAVEAVPVIGPIISTIEELELDDVVDTYCMIVTFIFCGPIAAVIPAIPEFAEGIIEILPWWTISIAFWFFIVRPARHRMFKLKKAGVIDDEMEFNNDEFENLTDEDLFREAGKIYDIDIDD
jgi:hypothetical protein